MGDAESGLKNIAVRNGSENLRGIHRVFVVREIRTKSKTDKEEEKEEEEE